jgi:Concanavalin A-like lectin/glucanases superfamily
MNFQRIGIAVCLGLVGVATLAGADPAIYLSPKASPIEQQAAEDLQRYLYQVTKEVTDIATLEAVSGKAEGFVLGTEASLPAVQPGWPFGLEPPAHDGYIIHGVGDDNDLVVIAGATPQGVQNGVYGLLEALGFGFYLGGDTAPAKLATPPRFNESRTPAFAVRGTLPWHSYLNSAAAWDICDYKDYIDQLAHLRFNTVAFHAYDDQPFAAYKENARLLAGEPLASTASASRCAPPLATDEFFAGTSQYFAQDHFGAASSLIADRDEAIMAAKAVLRDAMLYAKGRGMQVGLGFEVSGNPLAPEVQARLEARLKALLSDYPMLDYVWLWEPEGMAKSPASDPKPRTPLHSYAGHMAEAFADLPDSAQRAEAARMALFAQHASQVLKANRPGVGLVLAGFGGDEWLRFSDSLPGMDAVTPDDVVFAALDNVRVTPAVSKAHGKLPADRQHWPILWWEFDGDQWMPQPNLDAVAGACADARDKGCQGLLGVHWRTRSVDDAAAFCARYAWNQDLTVEEFCARQAKDLFGEDVGQALAPYLVKLQGLGYRWVGGWGQSEGAPFSWEPGDYRKREQLVQIAFQLRHQLEEMGLLAGVLAGTPVDMMADITLEITQKLSPEVITELTAELKDKVSADTLVDLTAKLEDRLTPDAVAVLTSQLKDKVTPDVLTKFTADLKDMLRLSTLTDMTTGLKERLMPGLTVPPEKWVALEDLYQHIQYVLAIDTAANTLAPEAGLDDLVADEKMNQAVALIEGAKLAEAMHLYGRSIKNKGELGVLATMNAKAWSNLRDRTGLSGEALAKLTALPEGFRNTPAVLVLPGHVTVVGYPEASLKVTVKARRLGARRFASQELESVGRGTFALTFPEKVAKGGYFEYGIEVNAGPGKRLVWPDEFPVQTAYGLVKDIPPAPEVDEPALAEVTPVQVQATVNAEACAVRLEWDARPGEVYTVSREGMAPITVSTGWFEDTSPKSKETLTYTVAARNLGSGKSVAQRVSVDVPELPLPAPPAKINTATRASQVVLGWHSDSPIAAAYRVTKYDADHKAVGEMNVEADYGQYLEVCDAVEPGKAYSYSVTAIAPSGRNGTPSKEVGVVASAEPVQPLVRLSFEDDASMAGFAQLAENGIALGGPGWAELAKQPAWDRNLGITLSVWVKLSDFSGVPVLVCKGAWEQPAYFVQVLHDRLRFYVAGLGALDAGSLEAGKWQHVTATYGAGQMRLYIDGLLAGRKNLAGDTEPGALPRLAGRYAPAGGAYSLRGMMDQVCVYGMALTQAEVAALLEETRP